MEQQSRRNFLRTAALGIGAVAASPVDALASVGENPGHTSETPDDFLELSIFQTTDVHCQIHPHDELFWEDNQAVFRQTGGYGPMSTMLKKLRKQETHSFLVDTGDMFQGSQLSVKTSGKAYVPILNALAYDLYLPGNWEVIYGKKSMQSLLGSLSAPKICANMYHDLGEGKKGELIFQPYHIWHVEGVKIGFLGYTDPLVPVRQSPAYSKGIVYTKPEDNLAHYVDVLKNQEQCSFVIILAHLGLSQQIALANLPECRGVDYILGGDTHERVRTPIQCTYAKVVEPGAFGSFIGHLKITIQNGRVIKDDYELLEVNADEIKPDREMEQLLANAEREHTDAIHEIIGYSSIPLYRYFVVENTIDTLILDALRWQFPETDILLSNGFRFCPPKSTPDESGNIPITRGFLYDMLPVDSTLRKGKVTGTQLMEWLEKELNNVFAKEASRRLGGWVVKFNGMKVEFFAFAEAGKRVKSALVNGSPLKAEQVYSVLACEREGDPADMLCRIKGVKEPSNTPFTLHKAIMGYLKENSPVTPHPHKNAIILDAPDTLLTQVSGVDYTFR